MVCKVLRPHYLLLSSHAYHDGDWSTKPSCFLVSPPLDISNLTFAFLWHQWTCGFTRTLCNQQECMIILPEKPECFQGLLLDLHLVHSKHLVNCLHVIVPAALPVPVALVPCNFLLLLLLDILWYVAMPGASSSLLVELFGSLSCLFLIMFSCSSRCSS